MMHLSGILEDLNPWWRDRAIRPYRAANFPVRRDLHAQVFEQVTKFEDRRAVAILGPRRVGKSVLLEQVAEDLLLQGWPAQNLTVFDFSDDRLTEPVSPREVINFAPAGVVPGRPRIFLLDEIGASGDWGPWLKQQVDRTEHRYVVTDSAAHALRQTTRESGLGRWDEHRMETLSFREYLRLQAREKEGLEETFRRLPGPIERFLRTGGFPEHIASDDPSQVRSRLRSDIADRAIRRDLASSGADLGQVKNLLVYLLEDSGAIFDATKRARDLGADPRSVRDWLALLEDTLLVMRLERRGGSATGRLRGRFKPKVHAADHGLVAAFAPLARPMEDEAVRSRVYEAVVYRHLREAARLGGGELSYLRVSDDFEADFVLDRGRLALVIEVASGDVRGPEKIVKTAKSAKAIQAKSPLLIHAGIREEVVEGVRLAPLHRFLLDPEFFLGESR